MTKNSMNQEQILLLLKVISYKGTLRCIQKLKLKQLLDWLKSNDKALQTQQIKITYLTKYGYGTSLKHDVTSLKYTFMSFKMWKLGH